MKKFLVLLLTVVLTAAVAITGTVAYLQDTDEDVNVMTLGNVKIDQLEYERVVDENGNWKQWGTEPDKYGYYPDELQAFTQNKPLYPSYYANEDKTMIWDDRVGANGDAHQQSWGQVGASGSNQLFDDSVKNVQDKFVFVKNTGISDAYVRTWVAFEIGDFTVEDVKNDKMVHTNANPTHWSDEWVEEKVEIDGNYYAVVCLTYVGPSSNPNGVLEAGKVSYPSLLQVYLDPKATNEDCEALDGNKNGTYDILVFSQAVQTKGFDNADTALEAAFGTEHPWTEGANIKGINVAKDVAELEEALEKGENTSLTENVGTAENLKMNGGILNGNGNTLDASGVSTNSDCAVTTTGGTVTDITIKGDADSTRALGSGSSGSTKLTEDLYIDDVYVDEVLYAINGSGSGKESVYVTDSTVYGWISYSNIELFSFENCTLGKGNCPDGYFVVYGETEFTDCKFEGVFDMGARKEDGVVCAAGKTITFTNCTYDGVAVTAENFVEYFYYGAGDEADFGNLMRECTIIVDGVKVDNSEYVK